MNTIADLTIGQSGVIEDLLNSEVSHKLMEMGFIPGKKITLNSIAPLGDPYCFEVSGCKVALRREDAKSISVKKSDIIDSNI